MEGSQFPNPEAKNDEWRVNEMNLPDPLPSSLVSSEEENIHRKEGVEDLSHGSQTPPEKSELGFVQTVSPPPPLNPDLRLPQRMPRMVVDVDAYIEEDDSEEEDAKISNTLQEEDDEVPSPTASPKRTTSQKTAVSAVLGYDVDEGYDDYDLYYKKKSQMSHSSTDRTFDLSDDELGAVIPPDLRRHASTPGAFLVRGSGLVSVAPTAALTVDEEPVAATLVDPMMTTTPAYASNTGYHKNDGPMLVYAEPLWWKRRLVLCLSGWMLLALGIISLSVTLVVRLTQEDNDPVLASATPVSNITVGPVPTAFPTVTPVLLPTIAPTLSPVESPIPKTYAPGSSVAYHAVSWGVVANCPQEEEEAPLFQNEAFLSCGSGLEILNTTEGVDCQFRSEDRVACHLNATAAPAGMRQATGLVLFSCRGFVEQDWTATVDLPEAPVANCSTAAEPLASNFVSLGRFCLESRQWILRHQVYKCEEGLRHVIPSRRRKTLGFFDLFDIVLYGIVRFTNITSFCYSDINCTDASWMSCAVPRTTMVNADDLCELSGAGPAPNAAYFWEAAQVALDPAQRVNALVDDYSTVFT